MPVDLSQLKTRSIEWLKQLIQTPSLSREEHKTAELLMSFLSEYNIQVKRKYNNIWTESYNHPKGARKILLNSHHDTVKPGENWLNDPFKALIEEDRITGLGSNDAGASVVALMVAFIYLQQLPELSYKLILSLTAEEEISGERGIKSLFSELGKIDLGIVGEPTGMHVAIAEKGVIVLDCYAYGKTGHAAREEGLNALYIALEDIAWIRNSRFEKISELLGPMKLTVTQIQAGIQHNVVPDTCRYVVDIRTNELYRNEEVVDYIRKNIQSEIMPRSYHLNSSRISKAHPIVQKALSIGRKTYGSPTLSDQSLMSFDTIKMGVGESSRSHTPNEFVLYSEIMSGIDIYINLLKYFSF
ncbi:M20 family metallo-hydrolase [Bacteroidetes bacterium endosymbiont of Geopemphigus sp.]|uniref:M20 family metallo-hydrolase n=1 Tax=Bacteroidetes bacterium endosymbiont of Geopemphigus sp. TaxID=2047937 RepID=UPI000CD0E801|nr:M20 family metallo-hydrolase [Bacteroidetes bacterium endosymbiont of Geopemphigus sp.]